MLRKEKVITMEREKQEAWELAKQLVQIDSSDPGAYEEEIGLWITDWFKKQIADFGGQLADQIHVSRLEVLPGRYNVMAKIPGKQKDRDLFISAIWIRSCWGMAGMRIFPRWML